MKIKSNLNCIHYFDNVTILPNINEISEEDFNKFKDNPIFNYKLDDGQFEILGKFNLQNMSINKATKFVNECIDIALLNSEFEKEQREVVKKAITNRIKDITSPDEVKK
ncbi:hypothetical protein ACWNT8_15625 (plasmid) [Pigmentibacter ruber]